MIQKLLLGYDIGSSSIKASLLNADTGKLVASAVSPSMEMKIDSPQIGWAEQHPETWWLHIKNATKELISKIPSQNFQIEAIGISYQMHGLVMVDKNYNVIYPSIIWCDSRAVEIGNKAFTDLGENYCLTNYLNSPGNFTASKLKWIKDNQPEVYKKIYKIMLPGDYAAMMLTDQIYTTVSGLSEGILWDFTKKEIAEKLINYFGFEKNLIPDIIPSFGIQGKLSDKASKELGLKSGIPVSYRSGDQPNNALSLNVLYPGEIAATAGTSGVIYGITDKNIFDTKNRVNTFAHVNYSKDKPINGVLLCINGTGIQYSWLKQNILNNAFSYTELNNLASKIEIGSEGLQCFPFGNGAERVLENKDVSASFTGINFNIHKKEHLVRAAQEGIAFSFKYGFDIMKNIGMEFNIIKAGFSNLFQSKLFSEAFVNLCDVELQIYNTDGSQGAARGAGIGIGFYDSPKDAFKELRIIERMTPNESLKTKYNLHYQIWKNNLVKQLNN